MDSCLLEGSTRGRGQSPHRGGAACMAPPSETRQAWRRNTRHKLNTHTHTRMVSHVASKDCDPKTLRDSPRCFHAALPSILYFGILWNTRSDDMGTKLPRAPALWTSHFDFSSSLSSSSLKPQDQTAARNATPPVRWQARGCAAFFFAHIFGFAVSARSRCGLTNIVWSHRWQPFVAKKPQ